MLNLDKAPGTGVRQQQQVAPILDAMRFEATAPERRKAKAEATLRAVGQDEMEAG